MRRKVIDLTTGSPIRQIFLFAIPMYTISLSLWHAFLNKKEHWWTVVIPWVVLYLFLTLYNHAHSQHDPTPFSIGHLFCWLSPLYGALLQGIIFFFRKKKATKREEQEYQEMISSVQGMFQRLCLTQEDVEKHIRKVTEEELANLISISKSVSPEELSGYYLPGDKRFITHSFEMYPNQVYLLKKIEPLNLKDEEKYNTLFWSCLDVENMNKDLYVFFFDSFGVPETYLRARRGYALYDIDKKDIVAYHWTLIS